MIMSATLRIAVAAALMYPLFGVTGRLPGLIAVP
jgi:hypothetical protein